MASSLFAAILHPKPRRKHDASLSSNLPGFATPPSESTYALRPGRYADVAAFAAAYYSSFSDSRGGEESTDDNLLDVLFEDHEKYQDETRDALERILAPRLWSLHFRMGALVDDGNGGRVVGFVCVKRPDCEVTFYERWISPTTWLNALRTRLYALYVRIVRGAYRFDNPRAQGFATAMEALYPSILCSPRRTAAWYLSLLVLDPAYQGLGLGTGMMSVVLERVEAVGARQALVTPNDDGERKDGEKMDEKESKDDKRGGEDGDEGEVEMGPPAMWLTARKGTEPLYRRFGFVKVMESSKHGLADWNGGAVMFRGLRGVKEIP